VVQGEGVDVGAKQKAEIMKGRLREEFWQQVKCYAAEAIRVLVKLPKEREEIRVLGEQPHA
jgi:hypothetical protein